MESTTGRTLRFDYQAPAAAKQVYRAFTNSTALREWMCEFATAVARVGGRFYVAWNEGFYAAGAFTTLQEDRLVAFTWMGRGEPGPTHVQVTFDELAGNTKVTLIHSGFGEGASWERTYAEIERGWQRALENLVSVVGSGPDLRITRRPMMGVLFSDFNADIAKTIGVPVTEGTRLEGTVEGLGARASGLQKNDVIVEIDGQPVRGFDSYQPILNNRQAGDLVKVVFYRGPERKEVQMALSGRQIPKIPATPAKLAAAVQKIYTNQMAELEADLAFVSEEEAVFHPAEKEWSIKEVVVHLILTERGTNEFIAELAEGYERVTDSYGEVLPGRVPAMAKSYLTLTDALDQYRLAADETVRMLEILPESMLARRGSYWRLAYGMLTSAYHLTEHREQIAATLRAARAI